MGDVMKIKINKFLYNMVYIVGLFACGYFTAQMLSMVPILQDDIAIMTIILLIVFAYLGSKLDDVHKYNEEEVIAQCRINNNCDKT